MKILHVITGLSTGGAERALYNMLAGGLAEKFKCSVLSLRDEGAFGAPIRDLGVQVNALNMNSSIPGSKAITLLRQYVRSFDPHIIQGWMYHGNLVASLATLFARGRPAVAWNIRQTLYSLANEKPMTRQVIRANRWLSGRAGTILYNSRVSRRQHEAFGFNNSRGKVIPNGFDLARLKPDASVGVEVRREFGIQDNAPVVGHVARFHPMKDHASFLHAAIRVARDLPAVRFLVVGREVSPENPALADILPPELLERFIFPGERSDVHRLMQAMDVLATSSAWGEGFPNVLGEAMASGVPCVTTDVGDSADIVGDTGIVVPPSNSGALAEGLMEMLRGTQDKRIVLGCLARARIEKRFALPAVVEQYIELYQKLIA